MDVALAFIPLNLSTMLAGRQVQEAVGNIASSRLGLAGSFEPPSRTITRLPRLQKLARK
jgi:hypothetical protein